MLAAALMAFVCRGSSFAAEKEQATTQDRVIAATCKAFMKGFIAVHDRNDLIRKLQEMDESAFNRRYGKAFAMIADSCLTRKPYSLAAGMGKEAVLESVKQMKKEEMFSSVDCISDARIAEQVRHYLGEKKQGIKDSRLVTQISTLWQHVLETTGMNK